MGNLALLKIIRQFQINAEAAKHNQLLPKQPLSAKSNAGFTLIELIVVVIIIAVLSAIAAPGWLAFTNRQRVSKLNDAVFSALQQAQTDAKLKKRSYSVSFRLDTTSDPKGILQVAVYQKDPSASSPPSNAWQPLNKNLEIKPGQVVLGTNLTSENNSNTSPLTPISPSSNTPPITFDYMGTLSPPPAAGSNSKGLIVAVASQNNGSTPLNGTKRCVVVKTLLGAMQIGQDEQCNP